MFRKILLATVVLAMASHVMAKSIVAPWPVPIEPPICPEAPSGYTYRWVPAVCRTVSERVWVGERTQWVEDWIQVAPGRWERVWRTITIAGHYETITRREVVSEGYWQLVRVVPMPRPVPYEHVDRVPGTVGVEGYSRGAGEDLSKFSGLSEWPK
jgi:hypothetical protein